MDVVNIAKDEFGIRICIFTLIATTFRLRTQHAEWNPANNYSTVKQDNDNREKWTRRNHNTLYECLRIRSTRDYIQLDAYQFNTRCYCLKISAFDMTT